VEKWKGGRVERWKGGSGRVERKIVERWKGGSGATVQLFQCFTVPLKYIFVIFNHIIIPSNEKL
jgi:hypothetical protein